MQTDSSKRDTGLFFFKGEENAPFAIMNAGGGFMYVGAMHDSFPHALEASKMGYNAFALIYRPDDPYADLAKAIEFIYDNADELQINSNEYSLWGGSAGARMAATLGNSDNLAQFTGRTDIPGIGCYYAVYRVYFCFGKRCTHIFLCWNFRRYCKLADDGKPFESNFRLWYSHRVSQI